MWIFIRLLCLVRPKPSFYVEVNLKYFSFISGLYTRKSVISFIEDSGSSSRGYWSPYVNRNNPDNGNTTRFLKETSFH